MKIRSDFVDTPKKDVLDMDDEVITEAVFMPDSPKWVLRVFNFLVDNQNLTTSLGGMKNQVTGLDKYKLTILAKDLYMFDLSRWMYAVHLFEHNLITHLNKSD